MGAIQEEDPAVLQSPGVPAELISARPSLGPQSQAGASPSVAAQSSAEKEQKQEPEVKMVSVQLAMR